MDTAHSIVRETMNEIMKRNDTKRCQIGGRLAKQAPPVSSRPRRDNRFSTNQNRDETNSVQNRSTIDDGASLNPSHGRRVTDGTAVRNDRDVLKLSNAKKTINIGTWNVRSLLGTGKADLLVNEMKRLDWDVIGLAELRWKGQGTLDLDDGCKILFSGAKDQGQAGVGFLLNDSAYRSMLSSDAVNERIISIRLKRTRSQHYSDPSVCSYIIIQ